MVQHGEVCGECTAGKCRDAPNEVEHLNVLCPVCSGDGCAGCVDGYIRITSCPRRQIPRWAYDCIDRSELYRRGLPVVAGGQLDQTRWWIEMHTFIQSEINRRRTTAIGQMMLWL